MQRPKECRHCDDGRPAAYAFAKDLKWKSTEHQFFGGCRKKEKSQRREHGKGRELSGGPLQLDVAEDQATDDEGHDHAARENESCGEMNSPVRDESDSEGAQRPVVN